MAMKIRLARGGSKKRPFYRIVATDSRMPRDGRYIERIGSYDPMQPKDGTRVTMDMDKVKAWIAKGAKPSDRVARFIHAEEADVWTWKNGNNPKKGEPGQKAKDLAVEKADKAEARKEAEAEAKEAAKVAKAEAAEAAKVAAAAAKEAEKEAKAAEKAAKAEAKAAKAEAKDAPAEEAPAAEAKAEEAKADDAKDEK